MTTSLDWRARLSGHAWTVLPSLLAKLRPPHARAARPWSTRFVDPDLGEITLRGALQAPLPASDSLLVIVHGLGGHANRHYCVRAANVALDAGWHALRISARGADRSGEDIHHAGLIADLEAVLADESLAGYRRVVLLGFSLGGHLVLRYLMASPDPRVLAGAAVCSPLDLASAGAHIDGMRPTWYRRHLLIGLKEIYGLCAARGRARGDDAAVAAAATIREFDAAAVVPRFGFASVDDYYRSQSAGPALEELQRPVLYCASTRDPMVTVDAIRAEYGDGVGQLQMRWIEAGGHVAFPADVDLGYPGRRGVVAQALRWADALRSQD